MLKQPLPRPVRAPEEAAQGRPRSRSLSPDGGPGRCGRRGEVVPGRRPRLEIGLSARPGPPIPFAPGGSQHEAGSARAGGCLGGPGAGSDLAKVDRTIKKEPAYTGKPRYCLLVFGPEAEDAGLARAGRRHAVRGPRRRRRPDRPGREGQAAPDGADEGGAAEAGREAGSATSGRGELTHTELDLHPGARPARSSRRRRRRRRTSRRCWETTSNATCSAWRVVDPAG